MSHGEPLRSFQAPPLGFLGMVVLIVVVELIFTSYEADLRLPIQNQWQEQGRQASRQAVNAKILCLGDSLVTQGVIPVILEQRLGHPAYNLALGGGQFAANYFLLRRVLESGSKPSALVIDALPLQLKIPPRERVSLWAGFLDAREALEMSWIAGEPDFLAEIFLAKLFTSIRVRQEFRQAILNSLAGSPTSNRLANRAGSRNLLINRGALIMPAFGQFEVAPRHHRWVYPEAITINRLNGESMERFFALAESHQIPVYWLLPPVCPTIQAQAERTGTYETHVQFVREVQRRHPGITVVDARQSDYPESAFLDSIHLARSGAAIFTSDLADAMTGRAGNRSTGADWVRLPRFRDRPIEFRHEDMAESMKAMTPTLIR